MNAENKIEKLVEENMLEDLRINKAYSGDASGFNDLSGLSNN